MTIGHFLRLQRQRQGITQQQCATLLGRNRSTYHRMETDKLRWRLEEFMIIARLLGREPGELLTEWEGIMKRES